jgi:hypothetical protein
LHTSRIVTALVAVALVAGCGGSKNTSSKPQPESTATSTPVSKGPLKFKVIGKCYSKTGGGTLLAKSGGFTPNSTYSRAVWYPKEPGAAARSEYKFLTPQGHTTPRGKAVFEWDCNYTSNGEPDPPGKYKLQITDDSTDRSKTVFFRILPAEHQ